MANFELFRLNGLFGEKFQFQGGQLKPSRCIAAEDRAAVVKFLKGQSVDRDQRQPPSFVSRRRCSRSRR